MNKASFSRLIKDSTYLSDADVLALEQVVQAFPYCQTAHMLLAKAASDKGSMLAPQRLRKAAIHAPSRALLKKLVEGKLNQPDPAKIASDGYSKPAQLPYNEEIEDLLENDLPEQKHTPETIITRTDQPQTEPELIPEPADNSRIQEEEKLPKTAAVEVEETQEEPEQPKEETAEITAVPTLAETEEELVIAGHLPEELTKIAEPTADENQVAAALLPATEVASVTETEGVETEKQEGLGAFLASLQGQTHIAETEAGEAQPDLSEVPEAHSAAEPEPENEQILEPAAVEEATEESGEPTPAPELAEEPEAATTFIPEETESEITVTPVPEILAETETEEKQLAKELTPLNPAETAPALSADALEPDYSDSLIFSIFRDNELGYAMSSSRMGESLQRKSELTREVPFHFQPELLVEYQHTRTGPAAAPPEKPQTPAQQDLINDFLKQASKNRPRANMLPKSEEQEDLSQKSTRLSKTIVSENLAQIFAMQGKTKKAIKIYQQLQLKMPEKKDYFAVLINKLQNQSS